MLDFSLNNVNIIYMVKGKRKKNCTRRTLYYFLGATNKYKGLAAGGLITTPIVIFIRNILAPLLLANMIQIISEGMRGEELMLALLPEAILLVVATMLRSFVFGPLRMWCVWKMEIKVNLMKKNK